MTEPEFKRGSKRTQSAPGAFVWSVGLAAGGGAAVLKQGLAPQGLGGCSGPPPGAQDQGRRRRRGEERVAHPTGLLLLPQPRGVTAAQGGMAGRVILGGLDLG